MSRDHAQLDARPLIAKESHISDRECGSSIKARDSDMPTELWIPLSRAMSYCTTVEQRLSGFDIQGDSFVIIVAIFKAKLSYLT